MDLVTKSLHECPQHMEECANILNEEWSRSKTARIHSLQKSNEKFPVCLVLLKTENRREEVIGHSRLSVVHGKDNSCLIESVCVKKSLRGKGYGRAIMDASEKFALSRGYTTMYLTTHDKQEFYKHLRYTFCDPVISFGVNPNLIPDHLIKQLTAASLEPETKKEDILNTNKHNNAVDTKYLDKTTGSSCDVAQPSMVPPSAPPPPPPKAPPPSAPPPPPPPLNVKNKMSNSSKPEIVKWDPRHISWMKKDLS